MDSSCQQYFPSEGVPPQFFRTSVSDRLVLSVVAIPGKLNLSQLLRWLGHFVAIPESYVSNTIYISTSVVAGNAQPVCGYTETSLNTPLYLPGG